MKKFANIAVAASMFALAACGAPRPTTTRYLVQVEGWDKRWYTIAIHTDIVAAEKDLASRASCPGHWRIEPTED